MVGYLSSFTVVGLGLSEASSETPVPGVPLAGGADLGSRSGPEPSVHVGRLQIGPVAANEVAFAP